MASWPERLKAKQQLDHIYYTLLWQETLSSYKLTALTPQPPNIEFTTHALNTSNRVHYTHAKNLHREVWWVTSINNTRVLESISRAMVLSKWCNSASPQTCKSRSKKKNSSTLPRLLLIFKQVLKGDVSKTALHLKTSFTACFMWKDLMHFHVLG